MSPTGVNEPLKEGELLAAIDLGSNSFHMVVARHVLGQLRTVDRMREMVRLAAGLGPDRSLDPAVTERALDCLARFGQRLRGLSSNRVRAIATNTVRTLRTPRAFLLPAETALGHGIDVVAGREEARLIYLGVATSQPPKTGRRLVIDIGGGSTEFIIGEGMQPLERESMQMGCVASTRRFFADGKISSRRWRDALTEVSAEFQQFCVTYRALGWQETLGSSGTIKAIGVIHRSMKLSRSEITRDGIAAIRDALLTASDLRKIKLPGLSEERQPVIAGGLLVLEAAFNELRIERMAVSETAMREGVLHDMMGRAQDRDPRDASVAALAQRYGVDSDQASRVGRTALALFDQVASDWALDDEHRLMLSWAARIHEIGLSIAHSQYHVHAAYVIEHSDIAGFSTQEQQLLAALLRGHRRSIPRSAINDLPDRMITPALRCMLLLRLAVLLHRSHSGESAPVITLRVSDSTLRLKLPKSWLDSHPLTRSDIDAEREYLADVGHTLMLQS